MDIQREIDKLIARSGGYTVDLTNPSNPSNMGISRRTLSHWLAREAMPGDVLGMTKQTARDIYYSYYYINAGINTLPNIIKPIMLDMLAVMGKNAIKKLQDLLVSNGYLTADKFTGTLNEDTITAAIKAEADLGNELVRKLVRLYVIYFEGQANDENDLLRIQLKKNISRAEEFLPENTPCKTA
jgi:lysozyme family protein